MPKFYFFTDPSLLAGQTDQQAFGPAGVSGGKDQFRVTDLHQRKIGSTDDVPAFAICDGLICAQTDVGGTLSLILKPIEQPPFDFPFISYIIYKGIDPSSLLTNGNAGPSGTIDTSKAGDNKLVDSVQKTWAANKNVAPPIRECLGLHLTPASTAADYLDLDLRKYEDVKPLDNLFYQGDPKFQLPLVRGGWRIGNFAAAGFGIEIVVERISYRPKIALARKLENVIEVTSLDPSVTYPPNDATYFMHWHAKEECLNFIDPCALWGSFFPRKLRVWNEATEKFDRKTEEKIYETVLRGPYDDASATAGTFFNRNRAYIDIRNEHGHSINYYKNEGPSIQLTMDPAANLDDNVVDYYANGWPSFAIDGSSPAIPMGVTGDKIKVRFGLPKTQNTRPIIYVSAGYRKRFQRLKDPQRFIDRPRRPTTPYLEEAAIIIPLIENAGIAKIAASYHKLCHFKRPLIVDGQPVLPADPNSLAPYYSGSYDNLFPLPRIADLPISDGLTVIKTYAEDIFVGASSDRSPFFVARPAVARDAENVLFLLIPVACAVRKRGMRRASGTKSFAPLAVFEASVSVFELLRGQYASPILLTKIPDPIQAKDDVDIVYLGKSRPLRSSAGTDDAISLAMTRVELSTLESLIASNIPTYPLPTLSIQNFTPLLQDTNPIITAALSLSTLVGHPIVTRWTQPLSLELYGRMAQDI
jgi:hypothetical protein